MLPGRAATMAASLLCSLSPASAGGGPIRKPNDCPPHQFRLPPVAAQCATFSFNFISTWLGVQLPLSVAGHTLADGFAETEFTCQAASSTRLCFRREILWVCEAELVIEDCCWREREFPHWLPDVHDERTSDGVLVTEKSGVLSQIGVLGKLFLWRLAEKDRLRTSWKY